MRLAVDYSPVAIEQLAKMKARAEANPTGAPATAYDATAKLIREVIGDSELAFARKNMLKGDLAGVFRVKFGRNRIFYLASSVLQRSTVLLLGYRKDGDKNDAYVDFGRLLKRGTFDAQFVTLNVAKPK